MIRSIIGRLTLCVPLVLIFLTGASGLEAQAGESIRVTAEEAQVLRGPSLTTVVLGVVKRGTSLPVIRVEGDWYLVEMPSGFANGARRGYVHAIDVSMNSPMAAERMAPAEPTLFYHFAVGPSQVGMDELESVWQDGIVFRAGTEVSFPSEKLGRFMSLTGDVALGLFGASEAHPNADGLQAVSGLIGVKAAIPTAVRPYLVAQGGYTTFHSGRASLQDALTGAAGGGLELHLSALRFAAFADARAVRTLGGDGYTPITVGGRFAP